MAELSAFFFLDAMLKFEKGTVSKMLSTKKITIEAKTLINGKEISGHRAIMTEEKISFLPWQIDKEACKEHRKVIREDAAEFEDYAYEMQEHVFPRGDK